MRTVVRTDAGRATPAGPGAASSGGDRVLVTDGGNGQSRSTLAAVRALARAGYRPTVTVSGGWSMAAASRYCALRVDVPPVTDPGYAPAVRTELSAPGYLTVLPTSDASLLALGFPVERIVDKAALAGRAAACGLPFPPSRVYPSPEDLARDGAGLRYPLVVKPTRTRYRAFRADGPGDLLGPLPDDGPLIVQDYVTEPLRAVAGVVWGGRLVAAVHQRYLRTWPPACGGASAAVTVEPDEAVEERLVCLLEGYDGIFMAQLAGGYLLDLNPRVYGSLALGVAAGVNLAGILCDLARGAPVPAVRAEPGVHYRSLEGDIRHLAWAVRTGRMTPAAAARALRPRRGAAHGPESVSDPLPMVVRLAYATRRALHGGP